MDLRPDQRWVGHCFADSTLEAAAGMLGILQPCIVSTVNTEA